MQTDPYGKPDRRGEKGPNCPKCGSPTVGRKQRGTGKLYFGCENYNGFCFFNGRRDLPDEQPADSGQF